jgi:type IV pilus assembly protein PilY1
VSVTLLQQTEMPGDYYAGNGQKLRVLTGHTPDWTVTSYEADGVTCAELTGAGIEECDRNSTGERGDPVMHAGWYFDLPGAGERIPGDVMIRDGKVIAIGFTPEQTPCGSGGNSWVMELNACNGGQLYPAQFDINGDGRIDSNDMVHLTDADGNLLYDTDGNPIMAAPSGMMYPGRLLPPAVLRRGEEEIKYFSTNVGNIVTMTERSVPLGIIYWMELMQQ